MACHRTEVLKKPFKVLPPINDNLLRPELGSSACVGTYDDFPSGRAIPFVVAVSKQELQAVLCYVQQFFAAVAAHFQRTATAPHNGRLKHLIALSVIGTGYGGFHWDSGTILEQLLPLFVEATRKYRYDVVLVCFDAPTFSAAQRCRFRMWSNGGKPAGLWRELMPEQVQQARWLAERGARDELVLYFASELRGENWVARVATESKLFEADELRQLASLSLPDQAKFVKARFCERLGGEAAFFQALKRQLSSDEITLYHALLANLPCKHTSLSLSLSLLLLLFFRFAAVAVFFF